MDILLKPARVATSKPAQRTYLNTILVIISSTILLGLAVIAYWLFYFNYIPQIGIERAIHLQYGDGLHPYGIAKLDSSLISQQPYDIAVTLHLPRSPPNLAQGNFMLSLSLLRPSYTPPSPPLSQISKAAAQVLHQSPPSTLSKTDIILASRRPAILTYASRLISLSSRLAALPLYILNLRHESETLHIPMFETSEFLKGRNNVPEYVLLEVQAGQEVQVYDVKVRFTARFGGMRWVMYNHRIISFVVCTGAFWGAEMVGLLVGWLVLRSYFSGNSSENIKQESRPQIENDTGGETSTAIKNETDEPDLSDTPRTFPTYGRQKPLRFEPKVKDEDSEEYVLEETAIQPLEADDEDEDEERIARDSGLGTSFSEGGGRGGVARRRSRGGRIGGSG